MRITRLLALLTAFTITALAQLDQGQVSGLVQDPTKQRIPSAQVTITSQSTKASRSTATSTEGLYSITNLPVGEYDIEVSAPGFRTTRQTGIRITAAARVTLDVELQVGAVSESVTVEASTAQLQRDTAMLGRTVESRQINDLALNGRNPLNLTLMKAGVVGGNFNAFNPDSLSANNFTINGTRDPNNAITIDGVNAVRTRSGTATLGVFNADSIQEVQILTAIYPAEYGRSDGGQVRFVSRGGGSEFHGSAFYYFRNSALDANSWVRNGSPNASENERPAGFRFNQPGFSIGGPVFWPGKWNQERQKLFFFVSEEWVRYRREETSTAIVPTAAMRTGNFSELLDPSNPFTRSSQVIRDPMSGTPFVDNVIPDNRLSPNGIALLRAYPLPTPGFQQGAQNWISTLPAPRDSRKDFFRIDYYAGLHRISFSGQNYAYSSISPFTGGTDRVGTDWDRPNQTAALNITSTLSPTWVNDFTFSAANEVVRINNLASRPYERSAYGIDFPYLFPGTKDVEDKIPTVAITNFSTLDGGPYPAKSSGPIFSLADNVSWVPSGRHTVKFGFYFENAQQNNMDQIVVGSNVPGGTNNQNGRFEFSPAGNPNSSGVAIGNAALGFFNSYGEVGQRAYTLLRSNAFEAFAQDTWKVMPKLTLELGVRYAYYQPWYAKWNDIANFDAAWYDSSNRATVDPRGGFITSGDPYNGIVLPGSGFPESSRGRIPAENVPNVERLFHGLPRGFVDSYKLQFSPRLGFAYQLLPSTVLRGGFGIYQGRTAFFSSYLFGNPPNQVTVGVTNGNVDNPQGGSTSRQFPLQVRALDHAYRAPTSYTYSLNVQHELPGSTVLEVAYVGKHSINLRGARNLNQLTPGTVQENPGVNADALRPYHGLGIINLGEYNRQSGYHSLQVSADRRFRSGLGFGVAYTFSKLIDNTATPYDARNVNLVRALSSSDRPHLLNVNFIYELPFLKSRKDLFGRVVGDWQVSGVAFARSGSPLSVVDSTDIAGIGPGSGSQPWNLVGDPKLSGDRGLGDLWFDPAAFSQPQPGTYGNAGLNILRGPAFQNWDLALFKNFKLAAERVNAQFRVEVFNFPNHPLLSNPGTNPRGGTFGRVTSKTGERNLQLALRFTF